ncbi:PhzF family phenazine biosynthesis protein [Halorhabdus sp. BNX81]|uniref:PhzF family phenazine biosynthesis protein n=1 Tax=Halorhabdus sp. BNX81 TaxID=2980181 RepID=UPI0023DCF3B6|nr:PhzF family phenazine biosynthesis protein [Halorhabdus sp. BNX81]WEL21879.1 Putative epimerase, PhzC/PhzF-like [Halorhabdus sp. BNX81]
MSTDSLDVSLVDAFTTDSFAGNPAGVVPDAADLSADQMQAIAAELGASETAFVRSAEDADRTLRYFTPENEVDLCGHATIAAHARLFEQGDLDAGDHSISTNVGTLAIEIEADGTVWMAGDDPDVRSVDIGYDRLAEILGLTETAFAGVGMDLPIARASTGMPFLVVPVNYFEQLGDIAPNLAAIERLCDEHDATGLYVFTFDTLDRESTVHGRLFAPGVGVDEDPVTGTASGAVAAYLDRFAEIDATTVRCEQGDFLDRPGRVQVRVEDGVFVGGQAVTTLTGDIAIPDVEDGDIIEV